MLKILNLLLLIFLGLFCSCEKQVSVSPPDEPPPDGSVFVSSYPDSFQIYIDNKNRLRSTPDTIKWLETNTYKVTLKKDYFIDTTTYVDVVNGEKSSLFINIAENPRMLGSFYIESRPDNAGIFINDSNTTKQTPMQFNELLPGEYKYILKKENYEDVAGRFIVKSSETTNIKETMIDTTVWGYFNTSNSNTPTDNFTCLTIDGNNIKWFGSNKGVLKYDDFDWKLFDAGLPHVYVTSIKTDYLDEKWVTTNAGVAHININDKVEKYSSKNSSLPTGRVLDLSIYGERDVANSHWPTYNFATEYYIAVRLYVITEYYTGWTWDKFNVQGLNSKITSIASLHHNISLIGSENSGFVYLFVDEPTLYNTSNANIPSNAIAGIAKDETGYWVCHKPVVGGSGGLSHFENKEITAYRFSSRPTVSNCIYIDSESNKWVGADIGVYYFKDFSDIKFFDEEITGVPIKNITGIYEDKLGRIWLTSSTNGLFVIKDPAALINSINK